MEATQPITPPDHAIHRLAIEEWFLHRGMPSVTRASSGRGRLLLRAAPAILAITVVLLTMTVATALLRELEPATYAALFEADTVLPEWYYLVILAGGILAIIAGGVANRRIRYQPSSDPVTRTLVIAIPLALLLLPFLDARVDADASPLVSIIVNALLILLTMAVIRSGLGAIIVWSLRQALSQGTALASLAARTLPMIVLVTLFGFLSDGLWRVSGALSRNDLWLVVMILLGIAAIFIWTVIHGEMRQLMEHPHCPPEEIAAHGFPIADIESGSTPTARPIELTPREKINALIILFIALGIQIGTLVFLVFTFFCVFGAIAVPPSVIEVWTGRAPEAGSLMGMRLPIRHELVQTSLFLAAFSAVKFAASSVSDPTYRQSFFEPILRDIRVTLAARNLYRASSALDGPDTASDPAPMRDPGLRSG